MIRYFRNFSFYVSILLVGFTLQQCHDTIDEEFLDKDLTHIPYEPVLYTLLVPDSFPALEQPADNLMTVAGIQLGRKLFYDPILSIDSMISCSSCHLQANGFTDALGLSEGVAGRTNRGSMSLMNVGFHYHGMFWDGRSPSLETQALHPVEDPIEMGETWDHVEEKLKRHAVYPEDFRKAFGIDKTSLITRELAVKAIAQFERTLVSGFNSKYDRVKRGETVFTDSELNGLFLFYDSDNSKPAECSHCHIDPLFATNDYFNNGLQEAADFNSFGDPGLGMVTGKPGDMGKFKAPTLRNLIFTAPYMHDGRFQTLEEVIDHYNSGGHVSPTKNSFIYGLNLSESEKDDLLAFILTLTDSTVLTNEAYSNPF